MACLRRAVDDVATTDLDALGEQQIKQQLRALQREVNRLIAFRSKATGVLETRAIRQAGPGRESTAVKPTREFLEDELQFTPSEAKRSGQTGRRVSEDPDVARAYAEGRIREAHARVITEALRQLTGQTRAEVAAKLLEAAEHMTPLGLGRLARRQLAQADPEPAEEAERRRHARRYARVSETPDGMLAIHALVAGIDKETVLTSLDAFRTPDAEDERRSPEQASADALVAALRASLDLGAAPTQHGVRPHVMVIVREDEYRSGTGTGEALWTGPVSASDVQRLAQDAVITRVVVDANSVPIEVSEGRRTVASGLWKALLARDRGCRWPGCQAPPAWCDVAHGRIPHRDNGRLELSNALLLCRRHHRKADNDGWTIEIRGPDISFIAGDGRRLRSPRPG